MIEIDDTSVVEITTVDEYVPNETQTVEIGDEFKDTKTGNTVKKVNTPAEYSKSIDVGGKAQKTPTRRVVICR